MKRLINESNFEFIQRIGHKLAGNAGSYGFMELTNIGKKIEESDMEENVMGIVEGLNLMVSYLDDIKVEYI